jgi:hypothetical protein
MPIRAIARRACRERPCGLDKRVAARRVPEGDLLGGEVLHLSALYHFAKMHRMPVTYYLVDDIVPLVGLQIDLPLALPAHEPLQVRVGSALLAADPAVLELREVALEKADLVFVRGAGDVGAAAFDTEVVVHCAAVDCCFGLRDQLCAPHVAVPFGGAVDGDFGALLGVCVAGVLVRGRQVYVGCYGSRAVDVVLVRSDLVAPRPFVEVAGGGEVVETAIPQDST